LVCRARLAAQRGQGTEGKESGAGASAGGLPHAAVAREKPRVFRNTFARQSQGCARLT
jgi:hypothetical protein